MHPWRSAQKVLLCDLCETAPLQSHCELCNKNLCGNCAVKHISDYSKRHNVVHYSHRASVPNYPNCTKHTTKRCELHCEKCDIPVCSTCVSSGQHEGHKLSEFLEKLSAKTQSLKKDLEELQTRIYPRYEEMASIIENEKTELETNYGQLTTAADQQGEILHREITAIVKRRKSDIQEMKNTHLSILNKSSEEIAQKITELKEVISGLKTILKSNDVSLTFKSRNCDFTTLPPKTRVILPTFSPQKINKDQLNQIFGCLSSLSIDMEYGKPVTSPESTSSSPVKPLLDEPLLASTTDTEYGLLSSVSCLSEDQVWTCGNSKIMKLLNLQGEIKASIHTESGYIPGDIAMTRDGDLVYTDPDDKSVNLVKNEQIQTLITLQRWTPRHICSTSSDDLLVTMISDNCTQSKVVRYSGATEKHTIEFDDEARPLYSSGNIKYINENRNLDICVADNEAKAVVVVNQLGKFRFRYTGYSSNTEESFHPRGITTNSQSHILVADVINDRIHILDQDGHFLRYIQSGDLRPPWGILRYIQNCELRAPWGLCVDTKNNLFVAERFTAKVKKIQYL